MQALLCKESTLLLQFPWHPGAIARTVLANSDRPHAKVIDTALRLHNGLLARLTPSIRSLPNYMSVNDNFSTCLNSLLIISDWAMNFLPN